MTDDWKKMRAEAEANLNAIYAQEPWGKLAIECGFNPYNTESMAREAFRLCAEKLEEASAKAKGSEAITKLMASMKDPRTCPSIDDELELFANLIEDAKSVHGDLYEGDAP